MTCNLVKNPTGGGYTTASILELREFIANKLYDVADEAEVSGPAYSRTVKRLLKKALQEIGDTYNNVYLTEIVKQTEDILQTEFPNWYEGGYLPEQGIKNTISKSARKKMGETVEYQENVDEDDSSLPSYFLDKVFGNKAVLKNEIKQEATHILLNNFIIDRKNGTLVTSITEANINARKQKNELFASIIEALATDEDLEKLEGIDLVIYDAGGNYTGIMENADIINIIDRRYPFDTWDGVTILQLADKALIDKNSAKLYETFKNWFLLKNFDNFTKLLLGEAVIVNPSTKNKFVSGDTYTFSNKSENLLTTWRPDDGQVDLKVEISALAQSLVNSTPFLKLGVVEPTTVNGKQLYLKFEDFYRIVTKLKDIVTNPNAYVRLDDPQGPYGETYMDLSMAEQALVRGKSLGQIINRIRMNPQVYGKLAFKIIMETAKNASNGSKTMTDLGFSEQDVDKMWSIYEGFFDDSNKSSIVSIQYGMRPQEGQDPTISQGYDHNVQNYYSLMTQVMDSMYSVNYLQFYDDAGTILVRTLKEQGSDNTRQTIENNIYNTNSRRITKFNFDEVCMRPYKAKPTHYFDDNTGQEGAINGIEFQVGDVKINYLIDSNILRKDNKELSNWDKEQFAKSEEGLKFIGEQLCIDIANNKAFRDALEAIYANQLPYSELFNLACEVYFNRYLSNVVLKDTSDWRVSQARLNEIYKSSKKLPKFNTWLKEIKLVSDASLPVLERISQAHTLATGQATSAQVRDAEGNMISQLTLSRLLGYLPAQWDMIKDYMDELSSLGEYRVPFSLFKSGVYRGHLTIKEFKSTLGNKPATQFTVAEFMQSTFLHTFVGAFINDERKLISNGVVGFLPSVNSDKNTIGQILIDLNQVCSRFDKNPRYYELTQDLIATLIAEELGESYRLTRDSINADFAALEGFVNHELGVNVKIDPQNFTEFNKWVGMYYPNRSASDILFEWTQEYNHRYPMNPIKLTDQVHFIKNGKSVKSNGTLQTLIDRYSSPTKVLRFLNIKRAELFNGLLNENFQINLFSGESTAKAAGYLRDNFKEWVNHGNMVLGRLTYKGKKYNISSKIDLQEFQRETGIDVLSDVHAVSNTPGLTFELHPMLDKYNSLDYLFTQEFMVAGVGSHIAHPAKVKNKVPIVWGHPAIGKTYALENNPEYRNYVIDWDDEFNRKRDIWIANASGTKVGTPQFQAARNEYLINWAKHDDFKKFVKKEWERVKSKASGENKMIIASPAMLMAMFPKDFTKVIGMSREDFINRGKARGDKNPEGWKDGIDMLMQFTPSLTPKVTIGEGKYFTDLLKDGTFKEELALLQENALREEASRFLAQHKRNVSYTAAMHEYQLGQITGIPTTYNMAMMKDVPAWVYTMSGDMKDDADSFDGATFVNPWVIEWENNSLNSAKAGIDKKPFVHFYDERTHTGGIIKTAGFGVTNDRIRNYKFYRDMLFNMTHRPWVDENGNRIKIRKGGILIDFNGRPVDYGPVYFKRGGKYYMRTIDNFVEASQAYTVTDTEVDEFGNSVGKKPVTHMLAPISSNYGIYQMFGGWKSMEVVDGKLQWSEKSRELTAIACNNYGIKKPGVTGNAQTADDVYQPMKHSDIHYMPTSGAVKQGIGNVNPSDYFFKKVIHLDGYSNLNFMRVRMLQAGIQLDKEHHADNSVISLMTLVISAACAKGYMPLYSKNLYNALYELTKIGTDNFRNELGKLNIGIGGDEKAFKNAATKIILKTILNSTSSDGDMMVSIAHEIINRLRTERNFSLTSKTLDEANNIVPYSSPEIFRKVITSLSVALTKSGIKTEMPGNLAVLCPTHGIIKMYKIPYVDEKGIKHTKHVSYGDLEDIYGDEEGIEKGLQELQAAEPIIENVSDVELGFNYIAQTVDGPIVIKIVKPNVSLEIEPIKQLNGMPYYEIGYQDVKNLMASGDITNLQEYIMDGQDLRSYNVRFTANGQSYQMADLDIVQDYFAVKELKGQEQLNRIMQLAIKYGKFEEFCDRLERSYRSNWNDERLVVQEHRDIIAAVRGIRDNKLAIAAGKDVILPERILSMVTNYSLAMLNRIMQLNLNSISPNSNDVIVSINGQLLNVDKGSIKVQSYGCIMPKVFKSNFGLEQFDSIEEIKSDPDFFLKRLIQNASTKVENIPMLKDDGITVDHMMANYHLELKRLDGKHIYIRNGLDDSTLSTEVNWIRRVENGKVYRVDIDNNIIYQMFSENDRIFVDDEGNEIIVTTDTKPTFLTEDGREIGIKNVRWSKSTGKYMTLDTKEPVKIQQGSGIQFYLDNFDYFTININSEADDANFTNIRNRAGISSNKMARAVSEKLKGQVKQKKAIAKKLNDYSRILETKEDESQHLVERANQMRTSFMRSLKIIAARIPAQSQQSFMSMQVEQFANPDTNNAYVSIFQFYLQGSDLDIDAVSMQTYDIDENGILQGHSPYYSLETEDLRKASESLPFPTNQLVRTETVVNLKDSTLEQLIKEGVIGAEGSNALIEVYKEGINDKPLLVKLNLNNPTQIHTLARLIQSFNDGRVFGEVDDAIEPVLRNLINTQLFPERLEGEMLVGPKDVAYLEKAIRGIVDRHNTYLSRVNERRRKHIIKNYVTTQLFDIIEDPINRLQADSSVDVVTGPVKDLAKTSPKATVQNNFTPGNVLNKFQSIAENMVGKDGIAICATGLKSFFALTELEQLMLEQDRGLELLFNVKIAGKTYRGLANGYTSKFKSPYEYSDTNILEFGNELANYLIEQLWEADGANNMSAFLGLSTDNAKELVLAKINAGTATMGMYLYGLSIGMPIGELYRLMTSELGFRLTELTKGDAFSYTPGVNGILGALRYLREEPTQYMSRFDEVRDASNVQVAFLKPTEFLFNKINSIILGKNKAEYDSEYITAMSKMLIDKDETALDDMFNKLREIRKLGETYYNSQLSKHEDLKNLAIAKFNLAVDYIMTYLGDVALSRINTLQENYYGRSDIFLDLDKLAMGADEMKKIGAILRANQEIKTRPQELIQQVANIQDCISNRISVIKAFNRRHGQGSLVSAEYDGVDMLQVRDAKDKYKVDIVRFFTDEAYAQEKIAQYDAVKQSYNPLRIIHDVPHYRGYWESILSSHEGSKLLSVKYRILGTKIPAFISKNLVSDPNLKEQVYRNAENAIDTYFRRKWMLSRSIRITLPASTDTEQVYAFIDNTVQARPNYYPREIILGTTLGDANFKLWMERNVIPLLKRMYPDNKFLQDLQPTLTRNTQLGVISINRGLPISMMPDKGDEYGQDLLREYRESFNQLSKAELFPTGFDKMAIKDLFYLYSLISNNGRVGPNSLHGIMQDFDGEIVKSYRQSIAAQDKELTDIESPAYKDIVNFLTDEVLAPFSTPYRGGSNIFKFKDNKVDFITLYIKSSGDNEGSFEDEMLMEAAGMDPGQGGLNIPNGYVISGSTNMLIGSDFNYFTFPESVATEKVTTTSFDKGKIITQPIKNKKGEDTGEHVLIDIVPNKEYEEYLPQVLKDLRDAYDGKVPMVTVVNGGVSLHIIDQGIINALFEKYKNCP